MNKPVSDVLTLLSQVCQTAYSEVMMQAEEEQPSIGSVLHCALILLGYKNCSYEVIAGPSMFEKSNSKGMEALLHFLLSRLRGSVQAKKACGWCSVSLLWNLCALLKCFVCNVAGLQRHVAHQGHKTTKGLPKGDRHCRTKCHYVISALYGTNA